MKKSLFFLLMGLGLSAQEYCGTPEINPVEYRAKLDLVKKSKKNTAQTGKLTTDVKRYVPIQSHIFRNTDGTGGLTMDELNKGLGMLNSYFKDINIEFYLSGTTPNYINDSKFMEGTYTLAEEVAMHTTYGVNNAINMYNTAKVNSSASGYSYITPPSQASNRMFIVNGYYDDDKTTPHEYGHYFGLAHTFNNSSNSTIANRELVTRLTVETGSRLAANCTSKGDLLCDTPADPRDLASNSTARPDGCIYNGTVTDANGDLFYPLVNNVMDYNFCQRYSFTPEQYARMNDSYDYFKRGGTDFDFTAPVIDQPVPTNVQVTSLNSTVNVGATINWSETSNLESGYLIERATSPDGPFYVVGGVGPNVVVFTDLDLEMGQTYYYRVKPSNNPLAYSETSTSITAPSTVCGVNVSNPCESIYNYINGFELKDGSTRIIDNRSNGCSSTGYGDYYNTLSATLNAGQTYNLNETPPYISGFGYPYHYVTIFIDYNGDGDFSDTDEMVYQATTKNFIFSNLSFTVPSSVNSGEVRLRVVSNGTKVISDACTALTTGEYEDYKIVLVGQTLATNDALKVGDFQVYPNPNTGEKIYLSGDNAKNVQEVKLYSTDGKQISVTFKKNDGKVEVTPTTKVERGLYIISIKTDKETLSKKLIVK